MPHTNSRAARVKSASTLLNEVRLPLCVAVTSVTGLSSLMAVMVVAVEANADTPKPSIAGLG